MNLHLNECGLSDFVKRPTASNSRDMTFTVNGQVNLWKRLKLMFEVC